MTHTPGELTYQGNEIWCDGDIIAFMPMDHHSGHEREKSVAFARRIVTAVNAHDDLVEIANGVLRLEFALSSPKYISADIPILIDALSEKVRDLSQETTT